MSELAVARLDASTRATIDSVVARCRAGDFDDDDRPARLHGDLWSGNVMWTPDGVVLIDPAAQPVTARPTWRCSRSSAARTTTPS